ncbi:MAG: hypothetical protein K5750_08690 [Eubacterium sp.]|nr:hypothetical protein [Eubacterium sp.]
MLRRKCYRSENNRGSTMVETLVSFTVLFIVLAALYGIVSFSSELYMRSVDTSRLYQKFYREIYKTPPELTGSEYENDVLKRKLYKADNEELTEDGEAHAGLALTLDTGLTDPSNYASRSEIAEAYAALNHIGVESYVCKDGASETKKIILPKAVIFRFRGE